jgi:hypothetical protein
MADNTTTPNRISFSSAGAVRRPRSPQVAYYDTPRYRALVFKWMRREGGHSALRAWHLTKQYVAALS